MTQIGEENIFGKMRGRFDERFARIAAASLPDKFLATFMAMTEQQQAECMDKFNGFFQRPGLAVRFNMSGGAKP